MSVSHEQRNRVWERAGNCCEYCRMAQSDRLVFMSITSLQPSMVARMTTTISA